MEIKVLAFGRAREIVGSGNMVVTVAPQATVSSLMEQLMVQYPAMKQLTSFTIAVNGEYAGPGQNIFAHDEVAIIPPVSGG